MENLKWRTKYLVRDLANKSIEDIEKERKAIHKKYEVEKEWNLHEWSCVIPYLQFKPEWKVKITPPKLLGIIAFSIKYKNAWVSVFLDGYNQISATSNNDKAEPYWEMYPSAIDGDTACFKMNNTKGLLNEIQESIEYQNNDENVETLEDKLRDEHKPIPEER